ncbi:MAG: hypothetical protein JWP66_236, partial [Naasia sp.]|nr:hypothetical protein [Naasia sp.]
ICSISSRMRVPTRVGRSPIRVRRDFFFAALPAAESRVVVLGAVVLGVVVLGGVAPKGVARGVAPVGVGVDKV